MKKDMFEIQKVVPGCYHVQGKEKAVLFGAPPEVLKALFSQKKQPPTTVVLPDVGYVEGSSQVALEFLLYWYLFSTDAPKRGERFTVVGSAVMCERVKEALKVTLFGPDRRQMKSWRLSKSRISMLTKMMDYMALKGKDGKRLELEDMVDFVFFDSDETATVFDGQLWVSRAASNVFSLRHGDDAMSIDLNFSGEQMPLMEDVFEASPESPRVLRVKLLGTYSGFDTHGPTTGLVMWINYNGFLVDGPLGTSRYLRQMGIAKSDITGIILSHVHDDHCTLMDMILSEQVTNIITTREIYECMLIKVSNVLGESTDELRNYLVFTEIIPGKPCTLFGAHWEFFYTVHSIPTIGFRVTVRDTAGVNHTVLHSSDTCGFEMLEKMYDAGAISQQHRDRMRNLVRGDECLAMIDAGGPPIHGSPQDYEVVKKKNKQTDFLFYHVNPDTVDKRKFPVARPGWSKTYISSSSLSQALVLKLLKTMNLLDITDLSWINVVFSQGQAIEIGAGVDIAREGQGGDNFFFILAGSVEILTSVDDCRLEPLALLEGGDFFGEMSIIRDANRNATVRTLSPCVLFRLPGEIFMEFVEANKLKGKFEQLWLSRTLISGVEIFRNLHPHAKHEISMISDRMQFGPGEAIVKQGGKKDDFFVITKGQAKVTRGGQATSVVDVLEEGDFFGENVAMGYSMRRNATVSATEKGAEVIRIPGEKLREIAEKSPVLIHELHLVMKKRGMTDIPVKRRESRTEWI